MKPTQCRVKQIGLILVAAMVPCANLQANETFKIDPSRSTIAFKAASIDTGIGKRDEHLRGELFNVAKYPEITFKSRRVKQTGANTGEIAGDLTMHGVTRAITLNVQLLSNPEASRWRVTTLPLKRSEFGLLFSKSAETVSMIADEVAVEIEIEAQRPR